MKVLEFQKEQPEFKTPIWDYIAGLVDDERVADGKRAMAENSDALARAERQYGVSRYVIAAVWGVESNFGDSMGKRPLVQSLSTLACFGERASYFRGELMATLQYHRSRRHPAGKARPAPGRALSARRSSCPRPISASPSILTATASATSSIRRPTRSARPPISSLMPVGERACRGDSRSSCLKPIPAPPGARQESRCRPGRRAGSLASTGAVSARARPDCCCRRAPTVRPFWSRAISRPSIPTTPPNPTRSPPACWPTVWPAGRASSTPWPTDDPGLSRAERRELQTLLAKARLRRRRTRWRDRDQDQGGDRRLRAQGRPSRQRPRLGEGSGGAPAIKARRAPRPRNGAPFVALGAGLAASGHGFWPVFDLVLASDSGLFKGVRGNSSQKNLLRLE